MVSRMLSGKKLWTDVVAVIASCVTFGSGLVLLTQFHMGGQSYRPDALGISRLSWQNAHRLAALVVVLAVAIHVASHLRPLGARLGRMARGELARWDRRELLLYVGFAIVGLSGMVIWWGTTGSPPLWGPPNLDPIPPARHAWIDAHDLTGLIVLPLVVSHVRRRWRAFARLLPRPAGPRVPARVESGPEAQGR